jgi:putative effector of murein hydrolase LrgA (UPF0299 family)
MEKPVRLHKQNSKSSFLEMAEKCIMSNVHIILPICIIIMLILFALLCFAIVGVSATDSGLNYNHFQDVI